MVLLDEVEKAHPDVLNPSPHRAFDKGEMADGEAPALSTAKCGVLPRLQPRLSGVIVEHADNRKPW